MKFFIFILISYLWCVHYSVHMQRNYKSTSKESAFTSQKELSDGPLSKEVSLFNIMETKKLDGFSKYLISSEGRIFSLSYNKTGELKELTIGDLRNGYKRIVLFSDTKKRKRFLVHRIIAKLFVPNPLDLPQVNHINSNRGDNRAENLEWSTQSYNIKYGYKYGNCKPTIGELHGKHLLTNDQVLRIRSMWIPRKVSQETIARLFGVKRGAIKDIVERKTWKHI